MGSIILPIILGIFVGSLSGLVGIGGGVVLVPLLVYVFHLNMHMGAGTSLSIVIPASIVGALAHFQRGNVDFRLTMLIGLGAIVGSLLGTYVGSFLPGLTLKKIFSVILLLISLRTMADAFEIDLSFSRARPTVAERMTAEALVEPSSQASTDRSDPSASAR